MGSKHVVAAAALLVVGLPMAAAQPLEVGPGTIGPGSPVYGLEVAWDNAAVSIGLKKASKVAQERASEAKAASEKGNWKGAQKAADNMASVAKKAKSNETQGLQKAESVLQEVMANAPQEAQQGLQTALDNVRKARDRAPRAPGKGSAPGPGEAAPSAPGTADNDTPGNQTTGQQAQQNQAGQQQRQQGTNGQQGSTDKPAVEVASSAAPDRTIETSGTDFVTTSAQVSEGAVVRFDNTDSWAHTVTIDAQGVDLRLSAGESVTLRFNEGGSYTVVCTIHDGMETEIGVGQSPGA